LYPHEGGYLFTGFFLTFLMTWPENPRQAMPHYEERPFGNKTVTIIYFQVVVGGCKMIESKMNNNM